MYPFPLQSHGKRNLWTTLLTLETLLSNNKLVQSYDNKLRTLRNHYLLFEKKIVLYLYQLESQSPKNGLC